MEPWELAGVEQLALEPCELLELEVAVGVGGVGLGSGRVGVCPLGRLALCRNVGWWPKWPR